MNRATIRSNVSDNLYDNGVSFFQASDLNDSLQDAYNEIAAYSHCIIKTASLSWQPNLVYYDFVALGVTDYMGCIAIFNNISNLWLQDNLGLRDFDRIRRDWENWVGTVFLWAPHSLQYVAVAPHPTTSNTGTFNLLYWVVAPTVADDVTNYLVATDMTILLEWYATADQLEAQGERTKAESYWQRYALKIQEYKMRIQNIAHSDLLGRI